MSPVYPRAAIMIPAGQTSVVKPGQVWSFNDFRDTYSPIGLGVPGQPVGTIAASHAQYLWGLIAKNMIQTTDQRFAWVAMYKRDLIAQGPSGSMQVPVPAPYAQIFLVGVESRAKPAYDPVNDVQISASPLQPQYLSGVKMTPPTVAGGISTVTFNAGQPSYAAVGENTYLIISSDYNQGLYNGRIYRIGVYRPDISPTTWALIPGEDMTVTDPALNVDVFVVGRGADPNNPGQVAGSAQDVSVYTTYVPTN